MSKSKKPEPMPLWMAIDKTTGLPHHGVLSTASEAAARDQLLGCSGSPSSKENYVVIKYIPATKARGT